MAQGGEAAAPAPSEGGTNAVSQQPAKPSRIVESHLIKAFECLFADLMLSCLVENARYVSAVSCVLGQCKFKLTAPGLTGLCLTPGTKSSLAFLFRQVRRGGEQGSTSQGAARHGLGRWLGQPCGSVRFQV